MRNVHVLVIAEQRRLPALFLEAVDQPSRTPPDQMLVEIARRTQAGSGGNRLPNFGDVRKHVIEAIARVLRSAPGLEGARGYVRHPTSIGRPNVFDNVLIVVGLLINQKLGELGTGNDSCHNSLKVAC